jgi:hypothetical protein
MAFWWAILFLGDDSSRGDEVFGGCALLIHPTLNFGALVPAGLAGSLWLLVDDYPPCIDFRGAGL